jgi:hypothetical protein
MDQWLPCLQHRLALRPDLDYVCSFFDLPFKTAAKTWMDLDNKDPDLTRRRSQVAISAAVKEITGSEWLRSPLPAVLTCIRGSECAMRCTGRECSPTHMTPRHRTAPPHRAWQSCQAHITRGISIHPSRSVSRKRGPGKKILGTHRPSSTVVTVGIFFLVLSVLLLLHPPYLNKPLTFYVTFNYSSFI